MIADISLSLAPVSTNTRTNARSISPRAQAEFALIRRASSLYHMGRACTASKVSPSCCLIRKQTLLRKAFVFTSRWLIRDLYDAIFFLVPCWPYSAEIWVHTTSGQSWILSYEKKISLPQIGWKLHFSVSLCWTHIISRFSEWFECVRASTYAMEFGSLLLSSSLRRRF